MRTELIVNKDASGNVAIDFNTRYDMYNVIKCDFNARAESCTLLPTLDDWSKAGCPPNTVEAWYCKSEYCDSGATRAVKLHLLLGCIAARRASPRLHYHTAGAPHTRVLPPLAPPTVTSTGPWGDREGKCAGQSVPKLVDSRPCFTSEGVFQATVTDAAGTCEYKFAPV